jgi:hypothetical protein
MKTYFISFITLLLLLTGCESGFDSAKWKEHSSGEEVDNPRYRMTDDLQKKLQPGVTTQEEVIALLGDPGQQETDETKGITSLIYPIGWDTVIDTKPVYFVVEIGSDGKVVKSWVKD